jgi:hypothetical protein
VARVLEERNILAGKPEGRIQVEDLSLNKRIILKYDLNE